MNESIFLPPEKRYESKFLILSIVVHMAIIGAVAYWLNSQRLSNQEKIGKETLADAGKVALEFELLPGQIKSTQSIKLQNEVPAKVQENVRLKNEKPKKAKSVVVKKSQTLPNEKPKNKPTVAAVKESKISNKKPVSAPIRQLPAVKTAPQSDVMIPQNWAPIELPRDGEVAIQNPDAPTATENEVLPYVSSEKVRSQSLSSAESNESASDQKLAPKVSSSVGSVKRSRKGELAVEQFIEQELDAEADLDERAQEQRRPQPEENSNEINMVSAEEVKQTDMMGMPGRKDYVGSPQGASSFPGRGQVRGLGDLIQMPGNPKPRYSIEERRRGEQGLVVFWAYINSSGRPTRFYKVESTGYKNLDQKTLSALSRWRFKAGQEGWVELPFSWALTGGPVEAPSLLRR